MRVPPSAQLYRQAVRNLHTTLTEPVERQEAGAVYACLEMDGVLLAGAGNSNNVNGVKRGSGGTLC